MLHNNDDGKRIIVICPDYDEWGYSLNRDIPPFSIGVAGCIDNEHIYDRAGNSIVMPELYEWAQEMNSIVIASEAGERYEKDWADYHRRGLAIAHTLRKILSPDIDLWYAAPFEDKSGVVPEKMLIL